MTVSHMLKSYEMIKVRYSKCMTNIAFVNFASVSSWCLRSLLWGLVWEYRALNRKDDRNLIGLSWILRMYSTKNLEKLWGERLHPEALQHLLTGIYSQGNQYGGYLSVHFPRRLLGEESCCMDSVCTHVNTS